MPLQIADHPASAATAPSRVVSLVGQLDMETAPMLESALARLTAGPQPRLVVDLARLEFCDSIGLSTLILAHNSCVDSGGYLRIAAPTPFMLHLMSVVGVCDAVPVFDDVEEALSGPATPTG